MKNQATKRSAVNFAFTVLLLVYSHGISFAQQRVLVHEFSLLNESPEEIPEFGVFLKDTAFINPVLEVLERGIRSKVGELPVDYFSGRQIDLLSLTMNPYLDPKDQFKDYVAAQKAYYARFKKENRKSHDFIVKVHSEFIEPGLFKNQEGVKFKLRVKIREKESGKVFSGRASYNFTVQTPELLMKEIQDESVAIYQNFPVSREQIQEAYITALRQIFFEEESSKKQIVQRQEYDKYTDFMLQAEREYSMMVPVTYGYSTLRNVKFRLFGIPVLSGKSKNSDLLAGDMAETKRGRIQIREGRTSGLTDIDLEGPLGTGIRKFNRSFYIQSEVSPAPYNKYVLKGSIQDAYAFNIKIANPFKDGFNLKLYDDHKMLKTELKVYNLGVTAYDEGVEDSFSSFSLGPVSRTKTNGGSKSLHKILREHGRIYTPYIKAEGALLGQPFRMISNPLSLNNVELYLGDEMIGLLTHSKPTKKQLKKKKNVVPHVLYLKGGLSSEEEALVLQSFQMLRIGYAMNSIQRGKEGKIW